MIAQIFVSHSQRDEELKNFFLKAFGPTNVRAIFEEFEKIIRGEVTSQDIMRDIENSRAVFVILSHNVQNIPHTRDWVVWETGIAKNRDIWVFEPYHEFGRISIITPYIRHYAIFDTNDAWLGYIRKIIETYDDSHVLPTVLLAAGAGAAVARAPGAVLGAIVGLAASDRSRERPMGLMIECDNCHSIYAVHIPQEMAFRCPVCNQGLKLAT